MITRTSVIYVVGTIWMPAITAATEYQVSGYDLANMTDDGTPGRPPVISRESVALWLDSHAGDFQSVQDFRASLETSTGSVEIGWAGEDSGEIFAGCMWPDDDDDWR